MENQDRVSDAVAAAAPLVVAAEWEPDVVAVPGGGAHALPHVDAVVAVAHRHQCQIHSEAPEHGSPVSIKLTTVSPSHAQTKIRRRTS